MRLFTLLLFVTLWVERLFAIEATNQVVMQDCDKSGQGFSMGKGALVKFMDESQKVSPDVDLLFDMPHGLAANNAELAKVFSGKAGMIDLGETPLDKEVVIPAKGFLSSLKPEEILVGHSYLIRSADGEQFGKIHILKMDEENAVLAFSWVLLPAVQE